MTVHHGPPLTEAEGVGALTLGGFLDEVCTRFDDREALVLDDPLRDGATVRWTYAELREQARRIGRALIAAGVRPGDPVAVVMADRPEAVASFFGIALAGGVAVLVSTFAPAPELAGMLARGGVDVVLTQSRLGRRDLADDVVAISPRRRVVAVGRSGWERFLDAADPDAPLAPTDDPDATGLVIFSSGTTSEPKGIVHGHRSPTLQFWMQAGIFGRHPDTRMFTALPMFWTAGLNTAMGSTLAAGGCWVMQEVFSAGPALALLARERVTEPYLLPHQTVALAELPEWEGTDLSSLTCVYGKGAFARHPSVTPDPGWMMPAGYGLSETCAYFASHRSTTPRAQMVVGLGRLLPGTTVVVRDPETGRPVDGDADPHAEGELCIGGPTLFQRYLGSAPGDHRDADGLFPTGDVGRVDADGILHFTGRLSEVIRTGGANVSPAEVEVALRACPPVKLSRVIGLPDDRLGQVVVACITLRDGCPTTPGEVQAFLRERIAAYKVPRHVLFFADGEIPMTRSDTKVRDDALLALVHERIDGPLPTPTSGER